METFKYNHESGKVEEFKGKSKLARRHDVNKGESLPEKFSRVEDEDKFKQNLDNIFGEERITVKGEYIYRVVDGLGTMVRIK